MNVGEVYFGLLGPNSDPSAAKSTIPIDRAIAIPKGDPVPKLSSWRLSTGRIEHSYVDVYEMASTLVAGLRPPIESIVEVKEHFGLHAVLQVVLTISTAEDQSTPAIGFNADVLEFVNAVRATVGVDTYVQQT